MVLENLFTGQQRSHLAAFRAPSATVVCPWASYLTSLELLLRIWTTGIILLLFKGCQLQIGTCHGHWLSASTRIKSRAADLIDFQYPLKGAQDGEQWSVLGEKRTGKISIFRNQFYELNSGISSHLEKH